MRWLFAISVALLAFAPASGRAATPTRPLTDAFELAVHSENGEGMPRDYQRARLLYCEAAAHGEARAFLALGWMYVNGRGVARDDRVAAGWWRKAEAAGAQIPTDFARITHSVVPADDLGCAPAPGVWPSPAVQRMVQTIAPGLGLDTQLVMAVIATELAFDTHAVSPKNARGLMQLIPETAQRFGVSDPFNPEQNIRGGTTYLRWLLERYSGNLTLALAAYNAGEKNVDFYHGVPPFEETRNYIARIKRIYRPVSGRW